VPSPDPNAFDRPQNYDLQKVVGFYTSAIAAVVAISGSYAVSAC